MVLAPCSHRGFSFTILIRQAASVADGPKQEHNGGNNLHLVELVPAFSLLSMGATPRGREIRPSWKGAPAIWRIIEYFQIGIVVKCGGNH